MAPPFGSRSVPRMLEVGPHCFALCCGAGERRHCHQDRGAGRGLVIATDEACGNGSCCLQLDIIPTLSKLFPVCESPFVQFA